MSIDPRWIYPKLGRAGLGNELFPLMRAIDLAEATGAEVIPPRWFQPRIGPLLRGERDRRQYWRLFRPANPSARVRRIVAEAALLSRLDVGITVVRGMGRYFADLTRPHEVYRNRLWQAARKGVIVPRKGQYVSVHVRLGDFGPPSGEEGTVRNHNTRIPMQWYAQHIHSVHETLPGLPVVVSSNGRKEELAPLFELGGVSPSPARNALDELFLMAGARGLIGSRSTFSAWGAFLGHVPMIVPVGGNAYAPHSSVWEARGRSQAVDWLEALARRAPGDSHGTIR